MPRPLAAAVVAVAVATGCGGDGNDDIGHQRADQVRRAAAEAGLPDDVQDVLARAARATTATFQVTYDGEDGTTLVYSQDPPDVRVDTIQAGVVVESAIERDGATYTCAPGPGQELRCDRVEGEAARGGLFDVRSLEALTAALAGSLDSFDVEVTERDLAGVTARCLVATKRPGAPAELGDVGTFCVSDEGVQLLVETRGERLEARRYSDEVPEGTFDIDIG